MQIIDCLIIDDKKEARDRLKNLLSKFEYVNILSAEGDTEKAITKIIKLKPDLVFLEIEMPQKNGFDIANEIRALGMDTAFIFVTGYNQYAVKAIRNKAFDYLVKPVDIDELGEALRRFIC